MTSIDSFAPAQEVRVNTIVTANSTNVTPTTITLQVKDPGGTTTTYTSSQFTSTDTGYYYVDVTASTEGNWHYKWVTTGSGAGADYGQWKVLDSQFD